MRIQWLSGCWNQIVTKLNRRFRMRMQRARHSRKRSQGTCVSQLTEPLESRMLLTNVNTLPVVITQPVSTVVDAGSIATFTALATGSPTPTVQWQQGVDWWNWVDIPGATSTTYNYQSTYSDTGSYHVYRAVFTNTAGSVTSNQVSMHVTAVITEQPLNTVASDGAVASFHASLSGNHTVQWQVRTPATLWSNIPGATADGYHLVAGRNDSEQLYRAVFTFGGANGIKTLTSEPALLTVATTAAVDPTPSATLSLNGPAITNASTLSWTVRFNQAVQGVDPTDFALESSGTIGTNLTQISGSGDLYVLTVSGITGNGTIGLNLEDNDSIRSLSGIPLGGLGTGNGSVTGGIATIDHVSPFVTSILQTTPAIEVLNTGSVSFAVTFSKAVFGVDASDFRPVTTGAITWSGLSISQISDTVYTCTVTGLVGRGTFGLTLSDDDSIHDHARNLLTTPGLHLGSSPNGGPSELLLQSPTLVDLNGDGSTDLIFLSGWGLEVAIRREDWFYDKGRVGEWSYQYITGDVNLDGSVDIVTNGFWDFRVLLGKGDGTFQPNPTIHPATGSGGFSQIRLCDLNGDGNPDIVSTAVDRYIRDGFNYSRPYIGIFLGNGDGTFESSQMARLPFAKYGRGCDVADMNGDGKPDLLVSGSDGLSLYLGNGDGTFQNGSDIAAGEINYNCVVSDLNGDGKQDVLFPVRNVNNDNTVKLLFGNGDGTFQPASTFSGTSGPCYEISVADLNADGNPDVVVSGSSVTVLLGAGDGNFSAQPQMPTSGGAGFVGDVNGDGRPDLVTPLSDYDTSQGRSPFLLNQRGDFTSQIVSVDRVSRLLTSIVATNPSSTDTDTVTFTATFSEPVTGIIPADFEIVRSGSVVAQSLFMTLTAMSPTVYTITLNRVSGSGHLGIAWRGAANGAGYLASPLVTIDHTPPTLVSISQSTPLATASGASSLSFTATFTEDVLGVEASDFQFITTGGVSYSSMQMTTVSPSVYRITAEGIMGNGTLGLNFVDHHTIQDLAGHYLAQSTPAISYPVPVAMPLGNETVVGDLNGDGKPDLVTSDYSNIGILLGNGDGTFQSRYNIPCPQRRANVTLADMNGDGILDIATANSDHNAVDLFLGNGNGTFQSAVELATGINPVSVTIGDFNKDGHVDLVVANNSGYWPAGSSSVSLLLGNGNGTFNAKQDFLLGYYSGEQVQIKACDINGDGSLDLVIAVNAWSEPGATIVLGNGDGTFQSPQNLSDVTRVTSLAVGDLNGDGLPDLALAHYDGNLGILLGNGNGTFQAEKSATVGLVQYGYNKELTLNDINHDGILDLLVFDQWGETVQILIGQGNGTFGLTQQILQTDLNLNSLAFADFNNDGQVELATFGYGALSLFSDLGDGTFHRMFEDFIVTGSYTISVTLHDINHDGNLDLIQGNNRGSISVLLGNGNGSFQQAQDIDVGGMWPDQITIADVNDDGNPDLIVRNSYSSGVLLGNGNGSFQAMHLLLIDPWLSFYPGRGSVAVGDVNGDGKVDLVFSDLDGTNGSGIHVFLGDGNGNFQFAGDVPSGAAQDSISIGDFNGDGHQDLINGIVFLGNGDGTFAYDESDYVADTVGDFNNDGNLDYLYMGLYYDSSNIIHNGIRIWCPSSQHTSSLQELAIGNNPVSATASDLNGDGNLDITVTYKDSIEIFLGNGDGTFQGRQDFNLGSPLNYYRWAIGDLNHDGKQDVVATWGDLAHVFLANANADFTGPVYTINHSLLANSDQLVVAKNRVDYAAIDVTANDTNPDGQPLTILSTTSAAHGVVAILQNGSQLGYHPNPGFTGTDTFDYTIVNPDGLIATATVAVTVSDLAQSIVVDIAGDTEQAGHTTLRQAIALANADDSGDTITFDSSLAGNTITLTQGELLVTGSMTITGLGASQLAIDGGMTSRIFDISNPNEQTSVTITGLTLQNGSGSGLYNDGYGGAIYNTQQLTLAFNRLTSNSAQFAGGAIDNDLAGLVTATGNTITDNTAIYYGGGVVNSGSYISLNETVSGNSTSNFGGGIYNEGIFIGTNDTIANNTVAIGLGGGLFNDATMTTIHLTVTGNSAVSGGGFANFNTLNAINTLIVGNSATINSDLTGLLSDESSHNQVGGSLTSILETDANGQPRLADHGGAMQTVALLGGVADPAMGTAGALAISSADLAANETTLSVASSTYLAVGDLLRMDAESVLVTAIEGTTITLARAQGATVAAAHGVGTELALANDQRGLARNRHADLGSFETQVPTVSGVQIHGGLYQGFAYEVTDATVTGLNPLTLATFGNGSLTYQYYAGTLTADAIPLATPLSAAPKDVGTYTVIAVYTTDTPGYRDAASSPAHLTITPANLTITAATNAKVYDGTTAASGLPGYSGLLGSDTISGLIEAYRSRNVQGISGSLIEVVGYVINDGVGGNDYIVTLQGTLGTITPASLSISAAPNTKVYDGTTSASAVPQVTGLMGTDTVSDAVEVYSSQNVLGDGGSTLSVTHSTLNDGNHGNNYTVTVKSGLGTITPASLSISAVSNTKVYDGTTSASAVPQVTGLMGSDTVSGAIEAYASKNVLGADASTLTVTGYVLSDGNSGQNYTVTTSSAIGTITKAALTITAASNSRVYDGTTGASAIPTVSGLLGTDSLSGMAEAYTSRHALGFNGSTLNVTGYTVNDGNRGGNYLVSTLGSSGTITPAPLTINPTTNTKVYDGTVVAGAVPTATGLLQGDTVTGLAETYSSKNVLGNGGSDLVVSTYTVNDGNSGQDYTVTLNKAAGTITPAPLTIGAVSNTKVYDGTTSASAVPQVMGLMTSDTVSGAVEIYASKNVLGTNASALNVTGYVISDGNSGQNYTVTTSSALGTITKAALTITAASNSRVYDGTTGASAIPTASGLQGTDSLSGMAEVYTSRHALGSNASTLNVTGYTVNDGNSGGNYLVSTLGSSGTITPAPLTIKATANTKVYDGTVIAGAVPTTTGLLQGDTVTGLAETYSSKNVLGNGGSDLIVSTYTVNDGNSGHDYTVTLNKAAGTVTPAVLTITAATNTKVFDGTTSANALPTVSGLKGSDTVSGQTEAYASAYVKGLNASVLTVSAGAVINDGNGGLNYTVNTVNATGTIRNGLPALTGASTLIATTGQAATAVNTAVTVSNPDSLTLASATVAISTNYVAGIDKLSFTGNTTTGNIVGTFNTTTGVLTLTSAGATATLAQFQAALRLVAYKNYGVPSNLVTHTVDYHISESVFSSNLVSSLVTVPSAFTVDIAPVVAGTSTLAYVEKQGERVINPSVTLTDSDNTTLASATVMLTTNFVTGQDQLGFTGTSATGNITASSNSTTGLLTLISVGATATTAQFQAALRLVTYTNTSSSPTTTTRSVVYQVSDGAKLGNTVISTITVSSVNDASVLSGASTLIYTNNHTPTTINSTILISDLDNTTLASATVRISANYATGQDVLGFVGTTATGNIVASFNATTGTLTLTSAGSTATLAQFQAALQLVTYNNTSASPSMAARSIDYQVSDGGSLSNIVTSLVTIKGAGVAPVLGGMGTMNYSQPQTAMAVNNNVTVSDSDSTTLAFATVKISGNYVVGQDLLGFTGDATTGNITASFNATTGTLTLISAGATATVAQFQAALRRVTYLNTSSSPSTAVRTLSYQISDGSNLSTIGTSTINISG